MTKRSAILSLLLNGLASIQLVWLYLQHVPSALKHSAYEQGIERTPFQYRLLMMLPMRWAHGSSALTALANKMSAMPGWFPGGVHPEALLQTVVDLCCVAIAGLVARRIYQATSRNGLLTPFIYPLTLIMIAVTYAGATTHALRFVYDFPALAFFAAGMYLIYFRRHSVLFAIVFLAGTLNRETTLLLLPLYAVTQCISPGREACTSACAEKPALDWERLWAPETLLVVLPLSACWIGWHSWLTEHFARNVSASGPRLLLNLGLVACPLAWPQLAAACCYLWPFVFLYRRLIPDATLRAWTWLLPIWLGFMLIFGLVIEGRIFGELVPLVACAVTLIAEEIFLVKTGIQASTRLRSSTVSPFSSSDVRL